MKKAFTLTESLVCMIVIGVVYAIVMQVTKPNTIKQDALKQAGIDMHNKIDYVTRQIIEAHTKNYTLTKLVNSSGTTYSIATTTAQDTLKGYYQDRLISVRRTAPSSYTGLSLYNTSNAAVNSYKVSTFPGFLLKNSAYFGLKLNGSCSTTEQHIYHPIKTTSRTQTKSCGLIFYDVNGAKMPNRLGLDQYIISIGENGIR